MAAILSFDEVNKLYAQNHAENLRSMPFEQFFGEMDLSEVQRQHRIGTAKQIYGFTRDALMGLYYVVQEGGWYAYDDIAADMKNSYSDMLTKLGIAFTAFFAAAHVESTVSEIISATLNHTDDPYYFSLDRAMLIAENEANSVWNDSEFQDAIDTGKTTKTWLSMRDKRVRKTHTEVDGTTIPINEFFHVGEAMLLYPRYASDHPEETVNCRCTLVFS